VFQLILPFQLDLPFEAQAAGSPGQAGPSALRPPRVRRARVRSGPASALRVEAALVTAQRDEATSAGLVGLEAAQP
jgi:hypothetical protein